MQNIVNFENIQNNHNTKRIQKFISQRFNMEMALVPLVRILKDENHHLTKIIHVKSPRET